MTKGSLSIAYGKLAYLERIGLSPLVAVKRPKVSLLIQRVKVKFRDGREASETLAAGPDQPDAIRSFIRSENVQKQGALSAIFEARTALAGQNPENKQDSQSAEYDLGQENGNSPNSASEVLAEESLSRGSGLLRSPETSAVLETPKPDANALGMQEQRQRIGQSEELPEHALPVRFSVLICTSHNLTVMALEPTLTPEHWNLIRNIALASNPPQLDVNEPQSPPVMLEFHWPIPGIAPSADQGAAAQSALSGFLAKQADSSSRFIVLGDQAAHAAEIYLGQLEASNILKAETLDGMLKNSNAKRDLWREMRARGFA